METFPADNDEQFEFIKSVIDECDYYVLIIAGLLHKLCSGNWIHYVPHSQIVLAHPQISSWISRHGVFYALEERLRSQACDYVYG